jgi:hypothetical protein
MRTIIGLFVLLPLAACALPGVPVAPANLNAASVPGTPGADPAAAATNDPTKPPMGPSAGPSLGGSSLGGAPKGAPTVAAPPAAGPVSVTIRSQCGKTVRVFYGDKPKFGSGTTSTISSNSSQSHSFKPGDQMWIVDDHDNGVSNATVSPTTRELEIGASCTGIVTR